MTAVAQTITFAKPANATLAQSPLTVSGTATSGLAVTFTTTTPTVCTAGGTNGATITLLIRGNVHHRGQPGAATPSTQRQRR